MYKSSPYNHATDSSYLKRDARKVLKDSHVVNRTEAFISEERTIRGMSRFPDLGVQVTTTNNPHPFTNLRHTAAYIFSLFPYGKIIKPPLLLTGRSRSSDINESRTPSSGRTWRWKKTTEADIKGKATARSRSRLGGLRGLFVPPNYFNPSWYHLVPWATEPSTASLRNTIQISTIKWYDPR